MQRRQRLDEALPIVDQLKMRLDRHRPLPPAFAEQLRRYYAVHFTYHTNAIEGSSLSLLETKIIVEEGLTVGGKPLKEHLEAIGHRDALSKFVDVIQAKGPITESLVLELHRLILYRIDESIAGRYRDVPIIVTGADYRFPPPADVPRLMADFWAWFEADETQSRHAVELAARAHLKFVMIHPFVDGNGRVARLLMNLILARAGYVVAIVPMVLRGEYMAALNQANRGVNRPFVELIAHLEREALHDLLRMLEVE